jgi:predicted transcriptional regulator
MEQLTGDISNMVFGPVSRDDIGEFSLDGQTLKVLVEMDGRTHVAGLARKLNMDLPTIRTVISKLIELGLAEKREGAMPILDEEFLDFLKTHLAQATGPIAEVLLEDVAAEMGMDIKKFPYHRAAELVDYLSREIPDEEKKLPFKQVMLQKLRESES